MREPVKMSMSKRRILNNVFVSVMVAIMLLLSTILLVGCNNEKEEVTPCENHDFKRIESELNRAPTYERDGREMRKCSVCGVTASFPIPMIEKIDGTEADGYFPLLDLYEVTYGDTLGDVAGRYFTPGWSFVLSNETKVGNAMSEPYDFEVVYKHSDVKYKEVRKTIALKVNKYALVESDVQLALETVLPNLVIPKTLDSLDSIAMPLLAGQKIKGTARWVPGQIILRNQVSYYEYIFTPEDTVNYEIYRGKVLLQG